LHKQTVKTFSENIEQFYSYTHPKTGHPAPLVSQETYNIVMKNKDQLDAAVIHDRDFDLDYFGFKTLEKSYLLKLDGKIAERPQHMLMRVSVGIHGEDIPRVVETYDLLSQRYFTHATPTLFNSGTPNPQMSSCFLLATKDDSIDGIYDTLKNCAIISKYAGGIGLSVHNVRASQSYIRGTNGTSNGIVPMLRVFNNTARYVDQGGGKVSSCKLALPSISIENPHRSWTAQRKYRHILGALACGCFRFLGPSQESRKRVRPRPRSFLCYVDT